MIRLIPLVLLALTACEGPEGPAGPQGPQGDAGIDGTDGTNGTDGENGDCYGKAAVDLTGLAGADGIVYTNYPVDIGIERAGTDALTYQVAGWGVDYAWDGDSFTATVLDENASSQVIIATDGCTVDTLAWDPQAEPGVFTVDVVHLIPGAPAVTFAPTGEEAQGTIGFEERQRMVLPWGEYAFDLGLGEAVIASVDATTYEPGSAYVMAVYMSDDLETVSLLPIDAGEKPVDPGIQMHLQAAHTATGVGTVDVYDVYSEALLFEDLAFGTVQDAGDVDAVEYGLAVDLDDDGITDADVGRVVGESHVGSRVVTAAYMTLDGVAQGFLIDVDADKDRIVNLSQRFTVEPHAYIDHTVDYTGSLEVEGCPEVGRVQVQTDIEHWWRGDISMTLEAPSGASALLWDEDGGSSDDIIGVFDAVDGTDLDGYSDYLYTREELGGLEGTDGNGTWTLSVVDGYSYGEGTVHSWTLLLECPL